MSEKSKSIAIVGATGAVGLEILECLNDCQFEIHSLCLLASARSAGKTIEFRGKTHTIEELSEGSFNGVDIALFSAGGGISEKFAPIAAAAGAVVIDNSSTFRMDPDVPLVIPEINPHAAKQRPKGIIANPNCTTIVTLMGLFPLHRKFGLKSIIASSYQAVSGSGLEGIRELDQQIADLAANRPITHSVYPHQIAYNVIPQIDCFQPDNYTKEELKMLNESRKILELPELNVTCTCVRVPVHRSHSVSASAAFHEPVAIEAARSAYADYPGVRLVDDPANNLFPTPLDTTGKDDCLVGRIRLDKVLPNALALWVVGDQVRKGAALNAVQIAQLI